MKIVVLSFKIVPASGPSARPPSVRPPVRPPSVTVRPSVRPPGPGPAEPIYIKLPIDRHGRLLLILGQLIALRCYPGATCKTRRLLICGQLVMLLIPTL